MKAGIFTVLLTATLAGCSHAPLKFTPPTAPIVVPQSTAINAPKIAPFEALTLPNMHTIALSQTHFVHFIQDTRSPLLQLSLMGIQRSANLKNGDVFGKAFQEWRERNAFDPTQPIYRYVRGRIGADQTTMSVSVLPNMADEAFRTLIDVWQHYPFTQLDLAHLRRSLKLADRERSFFGADAVLWWRQLSLGKDHPYAQLMSDASAKDALDHAQLKAQWQTRREADEWHLLISADQALEQILPTLPLALIQALPITKNSTSHKPPLPSIVPMTMHILDAPGDVQTKVYVGRAIHNTDAASSFACAFLAQWLGDSFTGRLFADLREQKGLAYSVGGSCEQNPLALSLRFSGATRLEHSGAFIAGILDHLTLAQTALIDEEELDRVKQQMRGTWRSALDSPDAVLDIKAHLLRMDRPWDALHARENALENIAPSDVQRMAKEILGAPLVMVLRTDAARVLPHLQALMPEVRFIVKTAVP